LHVINLPTGEMWSADLPFFSLAVRSKNECTLFRADQNAHTAHCQLLEEDSKTAELCPARTAPQGKTEVCSAGRINLTDPDWPLVSILSPVLTQGFVFGEQLDRGKSNGTSYPAREHSSAARTPLDAHRTGWTRLLHDIWRGIRH